jgi:hypothetical protein
MTEEQKEEPWQTDFLVDMSPLGAIKITHHSSSWNHPTMELLSSSWRKREGKLDIQSIRNLATALLKVIRQHESASRRSAETLHRIIARPPVPRPFSNRDTGRENG